MTKSPDHLPEEAGRRLLARAAELDAQDSPTVPVDQLRRAALEAGISEAAFDRALHETSPADTPGPTRYFKALLPPVATVGAFWFSLSVLARAALYMGAGSPVRGLVNIAALAIGVAVGKRLGARRTTAILLGLAASQGALWLVHTIWGIQSAQGAAINWLAIVAGVGGALLATVRSPTLDHPDHSGPAPLAAPAQKAQEQQGSPPIPGSLEVRAERWGLTTA